MKDLVNIPKINISQEKLNINFKFYLFLKYITKAKLNLGDISNILQEYGLFFTSLDLNLFQQSVLSGFNGKTKVSLGKRDCLLVIFSQIENKDDLSVFIFSLKLYSIKDLLLDQARIKAIYDLDKLKDLHPLSLEYDKITVFDPYIKRVNGALLSLDFFEGLNSGFFSQSTDSFILDLAKQTEYLAGIGVEANQIFMIAFNESINQSITSDSGSNYEKRILSILIGMGVKKDDIKKTHDKVDKSIDFDLFFVLEGKTYGIGAKRTLRERYKQFIKTAQMSPIDVMIEITLGTNLTAEKAKSITSHGIFLFVADEIYEQMSYLHDMDMVYSCNALSLELLVSLAKQG